MATQLGIQFIKILFLKHYVDIFKKLCFTCCTKKEEPSFYKGEGTSLPRN